MERDAVRRALGIVGWITGGAALAGAIAPFLLPAPWVHAIARALSTPHPPGGCPLCGMTTAFVALAHGDLAAAMRANPAAPPLHAAMLFVPSAALLGRVLGAARAHGPGAQRPTGRPSCR